MINALIRWSVSNRFLVLLLTAIVVGLGLFSVRQTPVDAIPDLSDVQVIVKTRYPGQAPQVVQDQVTFPLTTALLSVPGAETVRGFSFFGDSFVYVIFNDDTDLYWARSRVLEYLSQVQLPAGAKTELGPDATGVGWVFMYALVDRTGQHDLSELRSLQDWFLKFELQSLPGVSEVASVGGMVRQYQVLVDPQKLRAFGIPLAMVQSAIERGNQETGASVVEMAEAEYMLRATGYIQSLDDLANIPLMVNAQGTPVLVRDVAEVQFGPAMRRGVAELDGEGEVVGGIVAMRYGENAQHTIDGVKARLQDLQASLPEGVEVVTVYDRSALIERAVNNLWQKLGEELLMVALVCAVFLFHLRSSLVAIISLPVGILAAYGVMYLQGLNANIMSLGGIAIAIGAMIDGAIVMIENLHKHAERTPITRDNRWQLVSTAAQEVGPALFFSLLIITVSFIPVFTLEAQEGRLFAPLAYTKTYAMAAAAIVAVTLVPVLMGYFIRGRMRAETDNPINRAFINAYLPVLRGLLRFPLLTLFAAILLVASSVYPLSKLGSEFMPELDEGDLMYMPTTYESISIGKARELLQQTDKLIKTLPEVETVFGKVGRADTATDPAPLTMIETFIQLKPRDQWRPGMTTEKLKAELDALVKLPGVSNAWVMPIKTRIDMLATGIKTPVGIKVAGPDLKVIQNIGEQIESLLGQLPGTVSVYSERVADGRYITIHIDRLAAARFGLNIGDVQQVIATAVGGSDVGVTVEGEARYPINLRYPESYRDTPEQLALLPVVTPSGAHITLGDVAHIGVTVGAPGIKSENARLNGWSFIDIDTDVGSYIAAADEVLSRELELPAGYSLNWAGQYQYMERAKAKLSYLVPLTLAIIVVLLYLCFRNGIQVAMIMLTLPLALVGSVWFLWWLDFNLSVGVGVGMIALAGVAVETGVIMLVYLDQAWQRLREQTSTPDLAQLRAAVEDGAAQRLRPKLMTALATIVGLVPILWGSGTGSEVMSRLAAPMVGGMVSSVILTLFVLPVLYLLWRQWEIKRA
ncbi:efflux RND transporter permease subunit [Simiduia agarivorans]|uniref:Co/Zn/Cd efflux system membrane component n=1 Tax=Simiduia agarivorans (strain DSM 21679 / JCM 13881 / BCRC 17597 / SA1) TaxID=1117647 RepID=K4KMF0_SIMAS|nr:CusA/CzcA family heavy metal efflux RND transporter [Simiduia agarivorans]AFV00355.1 Co/Zn/Cd efflux system membrane component [Simiduia agarivorans SA1 = DSM 21679]